MTPTDTLTERYVGATLRRLPARQHTDIDKELRASIADAVEDRIGAGVEPAEAERAVLAELGDPARLAAAYADRPLHLIGPALFLDYKRLLTALLTTVVPAVAVAVGVARTVRGDTAPHVIGGTVDVAVTTGVHIAFWTTLVFAVIERAPTLRWTPARPWTLAALPQPPGRRARRAELIAQTVLLVLVTTALLVSPVVGTETGPDGKAVGLLSPWLWQTGVVYGFVALAAASLGLSFARRYLRWSVALTVATALVKLACATSLLWLVAGDRLLDPAFATAAHWPSEATRWTDTGLIVAAVIAIGFTLVEAAVGFATRSWPAQPLGMRIRTIVDGISGARAR